MFESFGAQACFQKNGFFTPAPLRPTILLQDYKTQNPIVHNRCLLEVTPCIKI